MAWYKENFTSRSTIPEYQEMTRTVSQPDADSSRTPGLHSSVQTSINDHGVRFYLCHNETASVSAVKSCQERLSLNNIEEKCRANTVGHYKSNA